MIAPATPPTAAPMMAPLAVEPVWFPITAPAAPPAAAPMIAPFCSLVMEHPCTPATIKVARAPRRARSIHLLRITTSLAGRPPRGRPRHESPSHSPRPELDGKAPRANRLPSLWSGRSVLGLAGVAGGILPAS